MGKRNGVIRLHDSSINIWDEPRGMFSWTYEKEYSRDVYGPIIRQLRDRGWKVGPDPRTKQRFPMLSKRRRYCVHHSRLEAKIEQSGRYIKVEFFQNVANVANPNGGKYDFGKLEKMPYLLRQRARIEISRITTWACGTIGYVTEGRDIQCGPNGLDADGWIAAIMGMGRWHKPQSDDEIPHYNKRGRDGDIVNGARVYFTDRKGRWMTGIVEHNINNMWWVKCGRYDVRNMGSGSLQLMPPGNPRKKNNAELSMGTVESLMLKAAEERDYLKADRLKRVLGAMG